MEKADINNKIKVWLVHKEKDKKGINGISKNNSDLILEFLKDYELGVNVGMFKGKRSPATLTKLRHQIIFFHRQLKKDFRKTTKTDLHTIIKNMEDGIIKKPTGKEYKSPREFVKGAKSFWGWLRRTEKIKENIVEDLQIEKETKKSSWVYLENNKMRRLIDMARGDYRALILFMFDSGLRPQETWRIRVYDFQDDYNTLDIPDKRENGEKVSKTFARKITLKKSPTFIKQFIEDNKLQSTDLLLKNISQQTFNKYLRTLARKLFGDKPTKARQSPDKMRAYDIRHNSAIFWLDKYQRNSDLMYRFGWKKEDKIFYYSEFLGKRDKIDDDLMLTEEQKDKYEKQIIELQKEMKENEIKDLDRIQEMETKIEKVGLMVPALKDIEKYYKLKLKEELGKFKKEFVVAK